MAANIPTIIFSAMRALGLNTATVEDDDEPVQHHAEHRNLYEPSPVDIAVVRAMLCRSKKLPPDLIDAIFDFGEYWAHSTTQLHENIYIRGGDPDREDKFLLRSYPLGLVDAGARQNANDGRYATTLPTPRPLGESSLDASFFAKSAKYPVPRITHPARKVVFSFRSQDQGWVTSSDEAEHPYSKSWTWFDAGLEKFDASGAEDGSIPSVNSLRPLYPELRQTSSNAAGYNYAHKLLHAPKWEIQRNKTAFGKWQNHSITWSYLDDISPDSEGGQALEVKGRGRETGDGKFVRELQVGDVVTVWGRARFGGWANRIESVRIDVYWAV